MPELDANARILHELEPVVASELDRHLRTTRDWNPHDFVPWSEGRNFAQLGGEDWAPDQSRLGKVAQAAMVVNLLTEDNLPSYHREIATQFGRDGAWGSWVGRWTAEEGRHAIALRDHLVVTRGIDPVALEQARMVHMTGGYDSGEKTALETIAYVTLQELATRISHRNTGAEAGRDGDELADKLLGRIALDENLHMVFYRNLGKAALDIVPNETMRAITTEINRFAMPGSTMPNFRRHAFAIAMAGIYDQQLHLDDVVQPTLRFWDVFGREDLTGDGAQARDELAAKLEELRRSANRFVERREATRTKVGD